MPKGIIYKIINHYNVKHDIDPKFYIGSKSNCEPDDKRFLSYWSSSISVTNDVNKLGEWNFSKEILITIDYNDQQELLLEEAKIQEEHNVVSDKSYYNQSIAIGPFYREDGSHCASTVWMNDGKISKRIHKNDVNQYLNNGFKYGRHNGSYNQNRVYINNGVVTKSVTDNELNDFITNGWKKGKLSGNQSNKMWINKNGKRKLIPKDQQHLFEDWNVGWKIIA